MRVDVRQKLEAARLEMYAENLRSLLKMRGYAVPEKIHLNRMDALTFTRARPHIPFGESETEEGKNVTKKARELIKKGVTAFDVLKVLLYEDTDSSPSSQEIKDLYASAVSEDPLGRGYVLLLWRSSDARRKLKQYRTGDSPRITIENPDIILVGLQSASIFFSRITELVDPVTSSAGTLAMVRREAKNFPKTMSDDVVSVFYGLVPGDVYRTDEPGAQASSSDICFRRVVFNVK